MKTSRVRSAYRRTENYTDIHPVKLIHLMYERLISHLELAREGVERKDPRKRGENLGKAIAIISELNASIRKDDDSEAAQFLRGLYGAMLMELPKTSLSNDVKIVEQAQKYVGRLKEIWEQTAMRENGLSAGSGEEYGTAVKQSSRQGDGYESCVPLKGAEMGVSVSI